jgi:negative regulator of replication initiation
MSDTLLTPAEAAAHFGVSERTIWRRIKKGQIELRHTDEGARVVMTDTVSVDDSKVTDRVTDTPPEDVSSGRIEIMPSVSGGDRLMEMMRVMQAQHGKALDQAQEAIELWKMRALAAEERVAMLEAPKEETPAEAPKRRWWRIWGK